MKDFCSEVIFRKYAVGLTVGMLDFLKQISKLHFFRILKPCNLMEIVGEHCVNKKSLGSGNFKISQPYSALGNYWTSQYE